MTSVKIMIAEDQTLFRESMVSVLNNFKDFKVIGEAENGKILIEKIKSNQPDLILLDLKMPEMDGAEVMKYLSREFPDIKVIVLTMYDDDDFILEMIECGANSYLLKDTRIKDLENTIREVMKRDFYYSDRVQQVLRKKLVSRKTKRKSVSNIQFTEQELEVLKLICREFSNSEIGEKLFLSDRTIEGYKRRLQQRVGAKSLAGLIVYIIKNGLVD